MIMFGSFLPSLLVGFRTTNFTRTSEPTLSWNQSLPVSRLLDRNNFRIARYSAANGPQNRQREQVPQTDFPLREESCWPAYLA